MDGCRNIQRAEITKLFKRHLKKKYGRTILWIENFKRLDRKGKKVVISTLLTASTLVAFSLTPVVIIHQVRTSSSYKVDGRLEETNMSAENKSASYKMIGGLKERVMSAVSGTSYILRGGDVSANSAVAVVGISSIAPASGFNSGTVSSVIEGYGFQGGAAPVLTLSGENDISASSILISSSAKITCSFDITGKKPGLWALKVTNPDGSSSIMANAFEVKTLASGMQAINYPNPFDPTKEQTTIIYQLDADADTMLLIFNISAELMYKQQYLSGTNGGKSGNNSIIWNGYNSFGELSANGLYFGRIVDRASGKVLAKCKIAVSR